MLLAHYVRFHILVKVTEWPPIAKIAAHSAYDMFSWYKYLIVSLVFSTSVFGVGIFFCLRLFLIFAYLYLFTIIMFSLYKYLIVKFSFFPNSAF